MKKILRQGNLYWFVDNDGWQLKTFTRSCKDAESKMKPVRLKDKLLKDIDYEYEKVVNLELWHSPNKTYSLAKNVHNEFYIFNLGIQMHDIKYLHQLQNLHHSLYQEELIIKLS